MAYCILKSYKLKTSPLAVFEALKGERNCFFLDSSLNSNYRLGRYSFLGIDPFYILESKNSHTLTKLREVLEKYKINLTADKIPFLGGAVGYLSYDAEWLFGFYNTAIVLDHFKKLLYIFSVGFPEKKYNLAKSLAEKNYKRMYRLLSGIGVYQGEAALKARPSKIKSNFTKPEYISAVKKAKEYIRRGDIYQINLSQRFQAKTNLSGAQIYKRLPSLSPSYFSAYFDTGNSQILSSSPERFLSLEGGLAVTRPMKGTRPRGENKKQDSSLEKELLKSAKDKIISSCADGKEQDCNLGTSAGKFLFVRIRPMVMWAWKSRFSFLNPMLPSAVSRDPASRARFPSVSSRPIQTTRG